MSKKTPATLLCDFYKLSHRAQYPDNTETVYSTWTPRSGKHLPIATCAISLGHQMFIKKILIDYFNEHFFGRELGDILEEYVRYVKNCLGEEVPETSHIIELHTLGYLPIEIKALPEGTRVPFRVPMMTVRNTDTKFAWLTNYLETLISCECWAPSTTATIADVYKQILTKYAMETVGDASFVPFQGHDFSMRGMMGLEASKLASIGHLSSFVGTDTIPAIHAVEEFYNGDVTANLIGTSVPATEHSVMCAGGKDDERETYRRLMEDVHPSGILSIVSDTWDLWNTVTNILPSLKEEIMARDGKVVIRPDSGNPVDIVCGKLYIDRSTSSREAAFQTTLSLMTIGHGSTSWDYRFFKWGATLYEVYLDDWDCFTYRAIGAPEEKGLIELLWETFGGTINGKGYKVLDPHIGAIYGDSITPARAEEICKRLKMKGFASTNIVFGIGSFTYTFITRDSLGFAMKSTLCVVDGEERHIFKDPKTDDGTKKSNTGAVVVQEVGGELICIDGLPLDHEVKDLMKVVFLNGKLLVDDTFEDIRERISSTREL